MPEALKGRARTVFAIAVALVVAAGILLRFFTHSALWLDEALTVDRSRLPIGQIAGSVKQDGAPPLYYYMLHFWMELFGESNLATRSLSGVIGVATLPVAWLAGNRIGGRMVAWTTVVLLASAPFAVYYSTEARMYALAILLTGCGVLALQRATVRPRPGNLIATGIVTAALLYTQYWSLYLVGTVGVWLLLSALWVRHTEVRSGDRTNEWKRSLPAFFAVAGGCLLFIPWLPEFLYQSRHTSTPWAGAPNFSAILDVLTGFTANQGSLQPPATVQARLLVVIYVAMFALALFGVGRSRRLIEFDLHTQPRARALSFVLIGTLFVAIGGAILTGSAFSPRYASVVFLPLLLLVALGTTTLLDVRIWGSVIALAVVAGMIISVQNINTQRTQAPRVAAVINAHAEPGDVIAFCPDQIGPAVYRVTDDPGRYTMKTFPRGTSPQFVDWVDYKKTVQSASPTAFASKLSEEAQSHRIWLVWESGYLTYGTRCEKIVNTLLADTHFKGREWVTSNGYRYYEPMNLTEYVPVN